MAKTTKKKEFSFSDLDAILGKATDKTAIKIEDSSNIRPTKCIQTGIYILNALLGKSILTGGIQDNRITVLAGESATGKSYLCYNIIREAQKEDIMIFYIDTEFAIEIPNLPKYGIDTAPDKFKLIRTNVVEDIKIFLTKFLDSIKEKVEEGYDAPKIMIILDSVGNMASRKEIEDALSGKEKADMTRAKALASLFRIISSDLGYLGISMLVTNHTYKCFVGNTGVLMADGTIKMIKDIDTNDYIKTLVGPKCVNFNKKYESASIVKITMADGKELKCTANHKFLVKSDWVEDENNECWKEACDLTENDIILSI